jgi:hypothetical protein
MFDKAFKPAYAANLKNFIACWRRDLKLPNLRFYLGELCTKTIWGMDNRDNILAIRTAADKAFIHIKAFDLPPQPEKLVLDTAGVLKLGEVLAQSYRGGR